jgi:uncharacterized iron-regulated protein
VKNEMMRKNPWMRTAALGLPLVFLAGFLLPAAAQMPAYRLYRENGKKTNFDRMVEAAAGADVVLFGELHDNPIAHWLQIELTRSLFDEKGDMLVLGAEMFEADNQLIMDEYMAGLITETQFEEEARLWGNYETDYKPLVLFALEHGLEFVATNIPRRYANSVYKQGLSVLDRVSDGARAYIAPLPLEYDTALNCYRSLLDGGGMMGHGSINLMDAQAIKDATMAHFILAHREPGMLFLHFNGAYHSDYGESINWFLKRAEPGLNVVTISTVSQDDTKPLEEEYKGKADFIICVPSTMTKTM